MHGSAHASWGQRADATGEAESNHGPLRAGDIVNHLREDRTCIATTMVDYYGMPQCGPAAWPGRAAAPTLLSSRRAETVEQALAADIRQALGPRFHPRRFVPYVVMHEFEALLFSDCVGLARSVGQPDLASSLQAIRDSFTSPEEIDDSPNTARRSVSSSLSSDTKSLFTETGDRPARHTCGVPWVSALAGAPGDVGASQADRSSRTASRKR